jgi:hypothetical protein
MTSVQKLQLCYERWNTETGDCSLVSRQSVLDALAYAWSEGTDAEGVASPDRGYAQNILERCELRAMAVKGRIIDICSHDRNSRYQVYWGVPGRPIDPARH